MHALQAALLPTASTEARTRVSAAMPRGCMQPGRCQQVLFGVCLVTACTALPSQVELDMPTHHRMAEQGVERWRRPGADAGAGGRPWLGAR